MVLISKQERRIVYEYLIQEGTIVVKKDASMPRHQNLPIPNLKVMMVCKSLASKKLLNSTFNWQWYYYSLTPEGIRGMCDYLGLPPNIKPEIYKPQASQRLQVGGGGRGRGQFRGGFGRGGAPREEVDQE